MTTFLLPGLYDSGPDHWQSQWELMDPQCVRIAQQDWVSPRRADWVATLDRAIAASHRDVVLVGHSTGCALVAHWAASAHADHIARVRGALLVGPSDPDGPNYPNGPTGFAPMPMTRLPFRTIVVASTDDVYVTMERAKAYAAAWGSRLVDVGASGHINGDSNLGTWPSGYELLQDLRRGTA